MYVIGLGGNLGDRNERVRRGKVLRHPAFCRRELHPLGM
jgi:7,8-dihydro-6-hydroxymethylpterin-pyrophosphokinase